MDDFNLATLYESRNEYCSLLLAKLSPLVIQGIRSIFDEAVRLCKDNDETEKYLMTFQNFLARVPKWNSELVQNEAERIKRVSVCTYLEELITCVHINQLKVLTSIRVGRQQKKIDISIPKLPEFVHRVYIEAARRLYKNVYLFDIEVPSLTRQKNARECEIIVNDCIMSVIRDSMPVESILRSYMDPTTEEEVFEEREEIVEREPIPPNKKLENQANQPFDSISNKKMDSENDHSSIFSVGKGSADFIVKKDETDDKEDADDVPSDKSQAISKMRIEKNSETGLREIVRKIDTVADGERSSIRRAEKEIKAPSSFESNPPTSTMIGLQNLTDFDKPDDDEKIKFAESVGGSDSIQLDIEVL